MKFRRLNERRLAIISGIACAMLIAILAVLQWQQARTERGLRSAIEQGYQRHKAVSGYLLLMQGIETGQRGYVVTGRRVFLQPVELASSQWQRVERQLIDAHKADPVLGKQVDALVALGRAKVRHAEGVIAQRQAGDAAGAADTIAKGGGKLLMDRARMIVDRLEAHGEWHSRTNLARASSRRDELQRAIVGVELVLFLSFLFFVGALLRTIRNGDRAAEALGDAATRQAAVFEGASDAMVIMDRSGQLESVNAAAERMFGRDRSTLIGKSNLMLFANPPSLQESLGLPRRDRIGPDR